MITGSRVIHSATAIGAVFHGSRPTPGSGGTLASSAFTAPRQSATVVHEGRELTYSYLDLQPEKPRWQTPVLFVHGAAGHLAQWAPQIDYFSQRCRTIALDLRGHGQSSQPDWAEYQAEEFCEDMRLLLEHLHIQGPVAVVAHSYGGAASTLFTIRYPERVERLVLLSTTGKLKVRTSILLFLKLPEGLLNPVQRAFHQRVGAPAHVLKKLVPNVGRWNGWDQYPKIRVPTLVMCGELDLLTRPKWVRRMAELIPGARYEGISFASHLPQLERSARVNEALQHFLAGGSQGVSALLGR